GESNPFLRDIDRQRWGLPGHSLNQRRWNPDLHSESAVGLTRQRHRVGPASRQRWNAQRGGRRQRSPNVHYSYHTLTWDEPRPSPPWCDPAPFGGPSPAIT